MLSYTDGLVGAVWHRSFITSPNVNYIPLPSDNSHLILRVDNFYAADDPLLWPQPFNESFCHLSVLKKHPRKDIMDPDWLMWEPFQSDLYFDWTETDGCASGFGQLKDEAAELLSKPISRLVDKIKENDILKTLAPSTLEYLNCARLNLEFTFTRIKTMPCTKDQAHRGWVEVQRAWLVLDCLWDYLTVFRPRVTGIRPEGASPIAKADRRLMGAFTHDERHALFLFTVGIPVWLIRPLSQFTVQNVISVVELKIPQLCMDVAEPLRVLISGHPGSTEKFRAIDNASHQFCLHPDPFEITVHDQGYQLSPKPASNSRREADSSESRMPRKPASRRCEPYPKPEKVKGSQWGKSCEHSINLNLIQLTCL